MRAYDLYWMTNPEWYDYPDTEEWGEPFLTDKATEEAKASFEHYKQQKAKAHK